MRWTDVNGVSGLYTGEVNEFKTPYGMGSMRYDDGYIAEGEWRNGTMGIGMEPDRYNEQDQYDEKMTVDLVMVKRQMKSKDQTSRRA